MLFCISEFRKHLPCRCCPKTAQMRSHALGSSCSGWPGGRGAAASSCCVVLPWHCCPVEPQTNTQSGKGAPVGSGGVRGAAGTSHRWSQVQGLAAVPLHLEHGLGSSPCLEQLRVLRKASVRLALGREIILFYRSSLKSGGRTEQMLFTWHSIEGLGAD